MNNTIHKIVLAAVLATSLSGVMAADFIPSLTAHDKPGPYRMAPLYDLVDTGGEMPYVQEKVKPLLGSIEGVLDADRRVRLGSSYNGATGGSETFVDLKLEHSIFSMHATAVSESADDYETAAGVEQRFGYDRSTQRLILGATPNVQRKLKLIHVNDSIDDHKMPLAQPVMYT